MTSDSPFAPICSRQSFLETLGGGEVLRWLDDGLGAREPFLLLTGGPGIGKTALAHEAVARWGSRVTAAFLAYSALTRAEFLEEIIRRFGAEPPDGANRSKLVACLEQALGDATSSGEVAMLVVDDAHDLSPELLEELRLLANAAQEARRPLEVLLIGLPTLEARLDEPALVALRQRVSVHAKLEPLSGVETWGYLQHRVTAVGGDGSALFSRKACHDIAVRTRGVPRQINALAGEALRGARVRGDQTVEPEHVQTAAAALGGFAPTGDVEDQADSGAEDSPTPIAAPRPIATERAPVVATARAPVVTPARAPVVTPAPAPIVAPTPAPVVAARIEETATPSPITRASHDPGEWVRRFVGDSGPVQISSQARPEPTWAAEPAEPTWAPEPSESQDAESPGPPETSPGLRPRPERGHPRSRPRLLGGLSVTTALLAALVVVSAVALVLRASGIARNRAPQVAGATTATAPQDANKARSRPAGASPQSRAGEPRSIASAARPRAPFTLDVGGYVDLESALTQRDRLQQLTGFEGWVVDAADGGGKPYRIVLGVYRSRARATAAADMLLNSKTLRDVTVVPLPPRSTRR